MARAETAPVTVDSASVLGGTLDRLEDPVFVVSLAGELVYANHGARQLVNIEADGGSLPAGASFAALWGETPAVVSERLARLAGSSQWFPFALTLAGGDEENGRVPLRGRGMILESPGSARTHFVVVRHDPNRSQTFAEHQRLIRRLNEELARGQEAERELARLLDNQTRLNRELIHRVKNNLALLASLLRQSRRQAGDGPFGGPLAEFERRLISVAAVHEVLDRTAETDDVQVDKMIGRICDSLKALAPRDVVLDCSLEPLRLHVDRATALALIVNELVTNAMKHAFPGGRAGTISLKLVRKGDLVEALIGDDGVGLRQSNGVGSGSRIVERLATQLGATIERTEQANGTLWRIIFRPLEPHAPPCGPADTARH